MVVQQLFLTCGQVIATVLYFQSLLESFHSLTMIHLYPICPNYPIFRDHCPKHFPNQNHIHYKIIFKNVGWPRLMTNNRCWWTLLVTDVVDKKNIRWPIMVTDVGDLCRRPMLLTKKFYLWIFSEEATELPSNLRPCILFLYFLSESEADISSKKRF